jgi:hypothetical protein
MTAQWPGRRQTLRLLAGLAGAVAGARAGLAQLPTPPPRPPAAPGPPTPAGPRPGSPAPAAVANELRATLDRAVERFEARDLEGVLAYVSDQYWTGPLTKRTVRAQLTALYQVHQQVRARVRLDEVRLVNGLAWVFSTGDVSGQVAYVGQWLGLFAWEQELEIARRENGVWRLYGYQQ